MGSLLNTLMCTIHYSWANARGQVIILLLSPCLYFFNYPSFCKEFILLNIFAFSIMQVVILSISIKNVELVRFLNFYNVSDIVILKARILFLYIFLLVHLLVFFTFSSNTIETFFILNLLILVFFVFRLVAWTMNKHAFIKTFIFLLISQVVVLLFTNSTIIITYNILTMLTMLSQYRSRSQKKFKLT